ncbi:Hint domain-containing protein [Psychromarinibacter halotolerans]|uniref:Hint domain-containing protein n=1 Tax=Psychromarinibacter halotolerans TaxID=1775175 RepID=A0ABV7GVR5_9RHOB|nr:Hint domain-containing protein [Psychromarinibacter halotolerans]MDF0596962.1 Hint domain-containing protein [Psychromarinibacter halotolerans]
MAIIITEIAFTAEGYAAFEIMNAGSIAVDIGDNPIFMGEDASATGQPLSSAGVGTIAAGEVITVGHSDIPGLDYNFPSGFSSAYELAPTDNNVFILDYEPFGAVDNVGGDGGPAFVADSSYQGDPTRDAATGNFSDGGEPLSEFTLTQPFSTNTLGTAVCFCAGTAISVPGGAVAVETLAIGDEVLTADGRAVAVKWIGRQTLRGGIGGMGEGRRPVRIAAGALGGGLPLAELRVTADHGMVLDGCVVNAGALVGLPGIDLVPLADLPRAFTVYHVETDAHEVILANGAPTETFVDAAERVAFDNHAEYLELFGVERIVPEMRMPRIASARLLPAALRHRLGLDDVSALEATG